MANPTKFAWVDPTTNTDGTPIAAGEITGYQLGIRNVANSNVGVYSIFSVVSSANAVSEAFTALGTTLAPGNYAAAIQTLSTSNGPSAWSSPEVTFTWVSTAPPSAPTGFTVS
jgi:hypothetical protein